jgi:hypothetical protein
MNTAAFIHRNFRATGAESMRGGHRREGGRRTNIPKIEKGGVAAAAIAH